MPKTIDLGEEMPDMGEPMTAGSASDDSGDKKHYPSIYLSGLADDPDLPDEGTATIRYKVRSRSKSENLREGESPKYSCDLDIMSITPNEGDDENSEAPDDDDMIEAGLSEAEKE